MNPSRAAYDHLDLLVEIQLERFVKQDHSALGFSMEYLRHRNSPRFEVERLVRLSSLLRREIFDRIGGWPLTKRGDFDQ
ncbi:MAG UNVERIFIED_CONTAM: hypothetical protein LVR18_06670 [Planctomycetaceae bacterium]